MKDFFISALAFLTMSCTSDYAEDILEDVQEVKIEQTYNDEDYKVMYDLVMTIYYSELFGIEKPTNPTYDELMQIAAPIVLTDTFFDTIGEGDCEKAYRLMLEYFTEKGTNQKVVDYLTFILDAGLY